MGEKKLYKYLDANGGMMMLYNSTLMFTNATQLNDPFDCHPVLRDLSATPVDIRQGLPGDVFSRFEYEKGLESREKTYVCSLSKVYNSILMWSYYTKHSGICIGLDMEKTRKYLKQMVGLFIGCPELEVQYKDIINGPFTNRSSEDFLCYHFATKSKEWQHEQEVRLITYDPWSDFMRLLPGQDEEGQSNQNSYNEKKEKRRIPWKEVRAFLNIGGECFDSIYLGVNLDEKKNKETKEEIIKVAKKRNPDTEIYQMTIDPIAFRLKEQLTGDTMIKYQTNNDGN